MAALNTPGAIRSDDLAAYAAGRIGADRITCALCLCCPCRCPAFGSPAYLRLIDARHGRRRAGVPAHPSNDPPATEGGQQ